MDDSEGSIQQTETRPEPAALVAVHQVGFTDIRSFAKAFAESGYFQDTRSVAQAIVKIAYGTALGIGPVQAMMGIDIIEGAPAVSAGLAGALVKRSGRYDYLVEDPDADPVVIQWYENGARVGQSSFGTEDARVAGLLHKKNWLKYGRAMRFARALTMGARMYCPDVFLGAIYTPEELGRTAPPETPSVQIHPEEAQERHATAEAFMARLALLDSIEEILDVENEVLREAQSPGEASQKLGIMLAAALERCAHPFDLDRVVTAASWVKTNLEYADKQRVARMVFACRERLESARQEALEATVPADE